METHDQTPDADHVVDVGEGDEPDGGQVMHKHDQEVLGRNGSRGSRGCGNGRPPAAPLAQRLGALWFPAPR